MMNNLVLIITVFLLAMVVSLVPQTSGAYINAEGRDFEHNGYLKVGGYDALTLKEAEDGETISFMIEPQVTPGKFDIYLFTSKQFTGYEAGERNPSALESWTKVYKVLDEVELTESNIILVVDNSNLTENGAEAMGQLNYTLTLKVTEEPFLKKNGLLIAGALFLVIVMVLALAIILKRHKEPDMPLASRGRSSSSHPTPPAPPGVARSSSSAPPSPPPPPSPESNAGRYGPPIVRGGLPNGAPPPPPPSPWSMKNHPNVGSAPPSPSSSPPPAPPPSGALSPTAERKKLITVKCPGCGIHIKHDPSQSTITCSGCGLSGSMG